MHIKLQRMLQHLICRDINAVPKVHHSLMKECLRAGVATRVGGGHSSSIGAFVHEINHLHWYTWIHSQRLPCTLSLSTGFRLFTKLDMVSMGGLVQVAVSYYDWCLVQQSVLVQEATITH